MLDAEGWPTKLGGPWQAASVRSVLLTAAQLESTAMAMSTPFLTPAQPRQVGLDLGPDSRPPNLRIGLWGPVDEKSPRHDGNADARPSTCRRSPSLPSDT